MSEQPKSAMTLLEMAGYGSAGGKPVYRPTSRRGHPRFKVTGPWSKKSNFDSWIGRQKQDAQNHMEEED